MNDDELKELLIQRDQIIAVSAEFAEINLAAIENEDIRELGRIVMEASAEDCVVYSST